MVTSSLRLIAGSNVLHRLSTPSHPPCALLGLTTPAGCRDQPPTSGSHNTTQQRPQRTLPAQCTMSGFTPHRSRRNAVTIGPREPRSRFPPVACRGAGKGSTRRRSPKQTSGNGRRPTSRRPHHRGGFVAHRDSLRVQYLRSRLQFSTTRNGQAKGHSTRSHPTNRRCCRGGGDRRSSVFGSQGAHPADLSRPAEPASFTRFSSRYEARGC